MKYFYTSLLTFALVAMGTISTKTMAEVTSKSDEIQPYPEEFKQDYGQECVETSMAEGLTETEAEKLCECTINKFQSQYSLEEFQKLTVASIEDEKAEMLLVEVGQVCFEQILYEQ